jgi:hypothetical protein
MRNLFRIIIPTLLILLFIILHIVGKVDWKETDYLSFGMIVLTYFYVVFTWEMLKRIETQNYLEKRPYIIGDFHKQRRVVKFYMKNVGKTPATNVKIELIPDVITFQGKSLNDTLFKNPIAFFPPEKKIDNAINAAKDFFTESENRDFQIKIEYEDSLKSNNKFSEIIRLNLNHLEEENDLLLKTTTDLVNSIDKLTNEIKNN